MTLPGKSTCVIDLMCYIVTVIKPKKNRIKRSIGNAEENTSATLHPRTFLMGVKLFIGTPLMRNKVVLKLNLFCYVKYMVSMATRYANLKNCGILTR